MAEYKTPGVYIQELNAFPSSVVEVETAVPAFIGYTEIALRGEADLTGKPTRLASLAEYHRYFGGPPKTKFKYDEGGAIIAINNTQFLLYYSMRLFFDNGGGPCWVTSIGNYGTLEEPTEKSGHDFTAPLTYPEGALCREIEPTMIVVPDAVLLEHAQWKKVSNAALAHCVKLQSRVAILDVYDGNKERTNDENDIISGEAEGFRNSIQSDFLRFGIAYYPWVNTSIVESGDVDYSFLDSDSIATLKTKVEEEGAKLFPATEDGTENKKLTELKKVSEKLTEDLPPPEDDKGWKEVTVRHLTLANVSEVYKHTMQDIQSGLNVLPPSAGMAGVYTRVDNTQGVFKSPANTGMASVNSPTVKISHDDQEDLNIPLTGKAINAIRTFQGRGVMIWGARTLDGNSQDWRYINVRRTLIMLEQSIKIAAEAFVFEPNTAATWVTVSNTIGNFLNNKWKEGALAGATPDQAYSVDVGLGSTMTSNDILDGYMRVMIKVAVVRPAEFIVLTFQQKMQTS